MKYRSLNKYTRNFSELTMKLTVSAGIAGTFIVGGQPAQAVNKVSEDKITPVSLIKSELLKAILGNDQQSSLEKNSLNPVLISQSLPSQNSDSLKKSREAKVTKRISTVATPLKQENEGSKTTILIQSNLDTNPTKAIPELPTLEIAENYPLKKLPKQIHTVRTGETITSIARKYKVSHGELIQINNIANPDRIEVDEKLILPSKDSDNRLVVSNPVLDSSVEPKSASNVDEKPILSSKDSDNRLVVSNSVLDSSVESKSSSNSDLDPYISRLRADVIKLRTKYKSSARDGKTQDSSISKELTYTSESDDVVATASGASSTGNNQLSSKASVSAAPMDNDYDDLLELSAFNSVTPELPPLSAPEKYLPSSSFNGYIWPAQGTFTSGYGWRWGRMHKGIDIAAPIGTPIIAAASGEVISAGWSSGGYGNLVKLRHQDGSVTLYAHNNRIYVRKG
ncbi:MAG: peptidoglycan DD-metalloendopeptidase family protein, partial [Xenococcaceae cyanobacterium MO_188.B19]|nr:peptidoglycan DD-metalloendopeptidase family protein [Xenococcaceae cyanobacterium MO_188.B19]